MDEDKKNKADVQERDRPYEEEPESPQNAFRRKEQDWNSSIPKADETGRVNRDDKHD
jgi:hypothetical protein